MIVQLIQRQVQIGDNVTFSLKNDSEASGVLIEIGRDHLTVEPTHKLIFQQNDAQYIV
jgi:hypothetical protein